MIIYNFIKGIISHITYTRILNKVYKDENLLNNLSQLFGTTFKKDWIGRIYTIVNPNISKGEYDMSTQVFEYGNNGLDNSTYVEQKIMEKLNIASQYITSNNLFDLLTYKIKKLDDYDNYLFIIQPITLSNVLKYGKYFSILILVMIFLTIFFLNLNIFLK